MARHTLHIETLLHREAFEYYYSLGDKRSLRDVSSKYDVSEQSTAKWSASFKWQDRVKSRDNEIARQLEDKTKVEALKSKKLYRAEIKKHIDFLNGVMDQAIKNQEESGGEQISVKQMGELKDLINSYEKLCRLDLLLMGEPTSRSKIELSKEEVNDLVNLANEAVNDGSLFTGDKTEDQ